MTVAQVDAFSPATEMLRALQQREIASTELLELHLRRIERYNPQLNAIVTPNYEGARRTAAEAFHAWSVSWASECLRVVRPGAHLAAFGAPRTAHRLACALEDAGFELRDTLMWLYGEAMVRPIQRESYPDSRRRFFGPSNEPVPAPHVGSPADEVLAEFRERVAPMTFNAQFPGAFSYFTPPPLAMSIGGEVLARSVTALATFGRLVSVGNSSRSPAPADLVQLLGRRLSLFGFYLGGEQGQSEALAELLDLVAAGKVEAVIDRTFPLAEAAAAHRYVASRANLGKVLLIP